MKINTSIQDAATTWKEINPSILGISLRGRSSEEVRKKVISECSRILSSYANSQKIKEYIESLEL